ncbi:MAG: hypothetical protein NUW37_03840 [Planctomycetes bacterium]|nr:hypothetical protein [Planctomycetota bacterium]
MAETDENSRVEVFQDDEEKRYSWKFVLIVFLICFLIGLALGVHNMYVGAIVDHYPSKGNAPEVQTVKPQRNDERN